MKKKILIFLAVTVALMTAVPAFAEMQEAVTENAAQETMEASGWKEKLLQADGVISVEEIPLADSAQFFNEKYMVVFDQPLDWSNPEAGSFPQRVEIGLRDEAPVTALETNGYSLRDKYPGAEEGLAGFGTDDAPEAAQLFGANYVNVEHRFFGESRPEDMSNADTRYWEYHTAENAANDYHRIYLALAPVLGDDWIATGTSRGGQMTNVYAYYYPEDMLVYIPYVAPCSEGWEDPRFYEFVYTKIGDDAFGPEEAAQMRDLLTAFQVDLLKYKEILLPGYEMFALQQLGCEFQEGAAIDQIYDVNVLESVVQFWQYQMMDFDTFREVLEMPETSPEEQQAKMQAEFSLMLQLQTPMDWSVNFFAWPYYVNAATTYGQYHYDFSYLREALKEAGVEDTLSVTEEMEGDLPWSLVFTEEQRAAFTYDGAFAEALAASVDTTPAKILMVFGATDPWFSLRIPETDNPNVAVFVHPTAPHSARISALPEDMRNEAFDFLGGVL